MPSSAEEPVGSFVVGLVVEPDPVVVLGPEIPAFHVFLRHAGIRGLGHVPDLDVREFSPELFGRQSRTRMQDGCAETDPFGAFGGARHKILLEEDLFLLPRSAGVFRRFKFVRHADSLSSRVRAYYIILILLYILYIYYINY